MKKRVLNQIGVVIVVCIAVVTITACDSPELENLLSVLHERAGTDVVALAKEPDVTDEIEADITLYDSENHKEAENAEGAEKPEKDVEEKETVEAENAVEDKKKDIPRRDQVLDFRYWEHLTDEIKDNLQELLNRIGNPTEGNVDFTGFEAAYTTVEHELPNGEIEMLPDGGLYLVAFVRNGMEKPVDISQAKITISVEEEVIENNVSRMERIIVATAYFHVDFGTIQPSQSIIQQFNFGNEFVLVKDADLSDYHVAVEFLH